VRKFVSDWPRASPSRNWLASKRPTSTVSREVRRNGGRKSYSGVAGGHRAAYEARRPKLSSSKKPGSSRQLEEALIALHSPTTIAIELARAGGIDGLTVSARRSTRGSTDDARGLRAGLFRCLHPKLASSPTRARWSERRKPGPLGQANLIGLRGEIAALYSGVGRRRRPHHRHARPLSDCEVRGAHEPQQPPMAPTGSRRHERARVPHRAPRANPWPRWRTLTFDQGREMARHAELAVKPRIEIFFAEPHRPCGSGPRTRPSTA